MNDISKYIVIGIAIGATIDAIVMVAAYWIKAVCEIKEHEKLIEKNEDAKRSKHLELINFSKPHPIADAEIINGFIGTVDGDYIDANKIIGFTIKTDDYAGKAFIYALIETATTISSGLVAVYHGRNKNSFDAQIRAEDDLKSFLIRLEKQK